MRIELTRPGNENGDHAAFQYADQRNNVGVNQRFIAPLVKTA